MNQPYAPPQSATPSWQQQQQSRGFEAHDNSVDILNSDIANLIAASKVEFAQNPYDNSIQTRLKALLDLQSILQSQKLPPDQIALIKDQVTQLSIAAKPQPPPTPVPAPAPVAVSQSPAQQPTLASLLGGPGALAALLARASATSQVPTPPPPQPVLPVRSPQPAYSTPQYPVIPPPALPPAAVTDPNSLLEKLRAAGMLPAVSAATSTPPALPASLAGNLPPVFPQPLPFLNQPSTGNIIRPPLNEIPNDVQLKPASLKM